MWHKRGICIVIILFMCMTKVSAQEIVYLPAGTLCTLDTLLSKPIKEAAVTLLPEGTVLWMDGKPLETYHPIQARDIRRVFLFAAKNANVGVTACADERKGLECLIK